MCFLGRLHGAAQWSHTYPGGKRHYLFEPTIQQCKSIFLTFYTFAFTSLECSRRKKIACHVLSECVYKEQWQRVLTWNFHHVIDPSLSLWLCRLCVCSVLPKGELLQLLVHLSISEDWEKSKGNMQTADGRRTWLHSAGVSSCSGPSRPSWSLFLMLFRCYIIKSFFNSCSYLALSLNSISIIGTSQLRAA